jgi:hypothetical protein
MAETALADLPADLDPDGVFLDDHLRSLFW